MRTALHFLVVVGFLGVGCGGGDPPNIGASCTATSGCDNGLTCNTSVMGGYCTEACTSPGTTSECPDGSVCDAIAGTTISCVKICKSSSDCRADQDCNGITSSNIKACKPK